MDYSIRKILKESLYNDILTVTENDIDWEKLNNGTVLITGANGFIAFYIVNALLIRNDLFKSNIKVIGIVRNIERAKKRFGDILERDDIKIVEQDVCEKINIQENADYVIHAASQASAWHFENDPVGTINANLVGTVNVLDYARSCNSKSVLFVSSLKVYGAVHDASPELKEEMIGYVDHTLYKNCYAQGKRASETLCASYSKQYGMNIKIARPSYIYGASSLDDNRVWAQFIADVVKRQNILLKSNGAPLRSFCYVSDTASAILTILLKGDKVSPYNISAKHSNITIRNFAKAAVEVFPERNLTLSFANKSDEIEPSVSNLSAAPEILNSDKLALLGWKAKVDIREGIRRAVRILEEEKC